MPFISNIANLRGISGRRGPRGVPGAPGGTDDAFAEWIDDLDSQTRAAVDGVVDTATAAEATARTAAIAAQATADAGRFASVLFANGSDQTAAIQAHLNAASPLGVKRLHGDFTVSDTITVPAGLYVDLSSATVTQTAASKRSFDASGAGATIHRGKLIGKGTDYAPGSTAPTIVGINVTAADVSVIGTKFEKFAGAGIKGTNAARLRLDGVGIVGVGGITTIPALDANCYGIYLLGGCTDVAIDNLDLTDMSIGLIGSVDTSYLSLSNIRIDRIPGQHGIYLQNGTGLQVNGVRGANVNLNLMKVQLANTSADHSYGARIANVSGFTIGDTVCVVTNTDTDLAAGKKLKGLTIANIRGVDSLRVLYLSNVRGGNVSNIGGENTTNVPVTIIDCQDVEIDGIQSRTSGREIIAFSNTGSGATGSSTQRVTIKNVKGYNPCGQNSASYTGAISIAGPVGPSDQTDITIDGVDVFSDQTAGANTYMRYGLTVNSSVDTSSLRVRNLRATGWTSNPANLASASKRIGEWSNCEATTTIANFPVGLLTRIGTVGGKTRWVMNTTPNNGVVQQGDVIHNSAPVAGGAPGWVATGAGGLHGGTWAASTAYTIADWRRSTTTGRVFECTVAGTSGGTEPSWNSAVAGDTFTDGGVTWVCRATGLGVVKAMANIAA